MDNDSSTQSDPIFRNSYVGAWLLGLAILALSILGLVRFPHWIWSTSIVACLGALGVNYRRRIAPAGWTAVLLAALTLALLVGAGVLAGLASRVAH
jgi:uncharacterized membrane protein